MKSPKHLIVDVVITCLLLIGAILLEAYAATWQIYGSVKCLPRFHCFPTLPCQDNLLRGEKDVDVDFNHSILIWHIATDLCYNLEKSKRSKISDNNETEQEWDHHMTHSKQLADYMSYILVMCPFMLPIGIGMIRFRDTRAEAHVFFFLSSWRSFQLRILYDPVHSCKVFPAIVKGDRSKSVLFEACKLAASLKEINDPGEMWKMVGNVWVEILGYAASQCRGYEHAQQLEKGGELLTHVWLLMAHLGITEHFKVKEGHGRVKLAVT
nr:disease resistance protein [Tanacetum cinerariifolium]